MPDDREVEAWEDIWINGVAMIFLLLAFPESVCMKNSGKYLPIKALDPVTQLLSY